MRLKAFAKVNLGLRVRSLGADGYHPLESLTQSITLHDDLEVTRQPDAPQIVGWDGEAVPAGDDNLAWRAVEAVASHAGRPSDFLVRLRKRIPSAAGLGGGSADAAAALVAAARLCGVASDDLPSLAFTLGADVPFCLSGGSAVMRGRGERLTAVEPFAGFALAIAVPPVELSTPRVFAEWDRLGEPDGAEFPAHGLPPQLRDFSPLRNDLYPAAVSLAPQLGEWKSELEQRWDRPVAMSGSGSSLFAYFVDEDEASAALAVVPAGVRSAESAALSAVGWQIVDA